jgi:hypothetical protein
MIDLNDTLCIMQRRVVKTILMAVIESGGHHPKTGLAIAMPVFAAFGVHHGCLKRLLEPMERSGWVASYRTPPWITPDSVTKRPLRTKP